MDFDSIISFLLLMAFFILPALLKRFKALKAKNAASAQAPKRTSIFDKIGEKFQNFVQELEQQATQQQKQADNNQSSAWDALAEDDNASLEFETLDQEDNNAAASESKFSEPEISTPSPSVPAEDSSLLHASTETPATDLKQAVIDKPLSAEPAFVSTQYVFKSNPLQNAVIWSEILGKPVGLRD